MLLAFSGTLNSSFKASTVWRFGIDPGVTCNTDVQSLLMSHHFQCLSLLPFWPIYISVQEKPFVPHFDATTGKHVCHLSCSSHRVEELISSEHQTVNLTSEVLSPHSPLLHWKSHYPSLFSFGEDPTLKYSLWFCPLWMLQSPGTGLNLSNGSSPVLRPLWLAIQWACQARGTVWLWRAGTGEDEWETSSSISIPVKRLTFPVAWSFGILTKAVVWVNMQP